MQAYHLSLLSFQLPLVLCTVYTISFTLVQLLRLIGLCSVGEASPWRVALQ